MYGNRRPSAFQHLPPGAQPPTNPTVPKTNTEGFTFQVSPPEDITGRLLNPWDRPTPTPQAGSARPRVHSMQNGFSPTSNGSQESYPFPEPVFYSAGALTSATEMQQQQQRHHRSHSDLSVRTDQLATRMHRSNPSVTSFASSYNAATDDVYDSHDTPTSGKPGASAELTRGLSDLSISSDEALRRFQSGELSDDDQEWHKLVPPEAQEALGSKEVQRQSVIFELIKSEKEYVADLETVQIVFIEGLRSSKPPIIKEPLLSAFIKEVFGNLNDVLVHHRRILKAVFARQREQHPLIQSVADIVLDTTLKTEFRAAYETYVKHYPLAESYHRKEMKRNRAYEQFIQSISSDPRIRKRDLVTFLSRPVTKLPRLNLILEQILKLTEVEYEHPDLEALPIILGILKDCIKSTQPGIEAAESKVKFWGICESLVFQKGEIIDMDLYDDSRTLVYSGPVARRSKSDTGFSDKWLDYSAALLDNYFLLMQEEKRPNGVVRRYLVSRPIPLAYLCLGSFTGPAESRREKAEDRGILDNIRGQSVPIYPFTVYHASSPMNRRYTFYVTSDAARTKWNNAFKDAIGVYRVRQESNMWFNPQNLTDGFFRLPPRNGGNSSATRFTGSILCVAPFIHSGRRYLAVGCGPGIYVALINTENYQWALNHRDPKALAALTILKNKTFNRLVVHAGTTLTSYPLDQLARVAIGKGRIQELQAASERVTGSDENVSLCKYVHVSGRALLVYTSKKRMSSSLNLQVLEAIDSVELTMHPTRTAGTKTMKSFRPCGGPGFIPKDAHDISPLQKTIGVCTGADIATLDPINLGQSAVATVPSLSNASSDPPMANLKEQLNGLKPLGYIRASAEELLVIYDEIGFYINKHGKPVRKSGYVKWETKADSFAHRNGLMLLISPHFVEVRDINTARIMQVIEGKDIRLMYSGPQMTKEYPVLLVMRGNKDDKDGVSEKIVELTETQEISVSTPTQSNPSSAALWDEWDM
ncbi:hypothetical protein D9619_004947 [Psilocybe cf. subviscida]|uniref:DH domain-containing protein n=1 Tax=Psilocybe cf. subviscida TaxID=2480587 RepID=A0A8H5BRC1_9AGAR|nr:hypothetical protein D9619_004947 [Psilocybe cf. subviscida]